MPSAKVTSITFTSSNHMTGCHEEQKKPKRTAGNVFTMPNTAQAEREPKAELDKKVTVQS